jgi:hypothetical protein
VTRREDIVRVERYGERWKIDQGREHQKRSERLKSKQAKRDPDKRISAKRLKRWEAEHQKHLERQAIMGITDPQLLDELRPSGGKARPYTEASVPKALKKRKP